MQAQVKYESEIKTALLGDRTITVKNLTPVFSPQEQDKRNREIERRLFDVFRKYAGRGQARVILVVRGRQRYNIIVGWLPFNGRELIMDSRIDAIYGRQSIDKKDSINYEFFYAALILFINFVMPQRFIAQQYLFLNLQKMTIYAKRYNLSHFYIYKTPNI